MPTLSASDYTRFLKYKAANVSPIRAAIQTRDNVALSQSIINANLLASQAAFVTTPSTTTVLTSTAAVTGASNTTVTTARADILTAATADGFVITYTSSQPHGLTNGQTVTISGFTGTLLPDPNLTGVVTLVDDTTFTIPAESPASGTATGTGRITGRVYYTTGIAHGLQVGETVAIEGLTTFSTTGAPVLTVPSSTTFVLDSTATGTADTGATGTIVGFVYYTTDIAHGLSVTDRHISVTGLVRFNVSLQPVNRVPSSTVFRIQSTATGTAVTGGSGVLTRTTYSNATTSITGNARVQGQQVPQFRSTDKAKSTLSWTSGTSGSVSSLSSSPIQRPPGGLPTGFRNSQGTYHRIPQKAGW
jgi:hypothetical protein